MPPSSPSRVTAVEPAPNTSSATGPVPAAQLAAELQALALQQPNARGAAAVSTAQLAVRLSLDRVTLAFAERSRVGITASSDTLLDTSNAASSPLHERLTAALAEAIDQRAVLVLPELREHAHPRITLAHHRLLDAQGGSVATLPFVVDGVCAGAVCVERHGSRSLALSELGPIEAVVAQLGPFLHLMHLNQRPLRSRLLALPRQQWQRLQQPGRSNLRHALLGGAVLLTVLALWPAQVQIGGHARLEGAVQRVLVAPADGFLGQVHVRPGDTVRAGQTLIELADRDLQLDQQRWQSQLAQHEDAYSAANARADRAQLVINQARAAEAEAQLALSTMKLARSRIEAPFDGIVIQGDLSQSLGAPVQQGAELMTLAPRDAFRVMVEVDERDIAAVRVGQDGTVALSALPWNTLTIKVRRITPVATPVEGRNVFEVEAELPAPPADLRPGLQGSAHIAAGRQSLLWSWLRRPVEALRLIVWEWWG